MRVSPLWFLWVFAAESRWRVTLGPTIPLLGVVVRQQQQQQLSFLGEQDAFVSMTPDLSDR